MLFFRIKERISRLKNWVNDGPVNTIYWGLGGIFAVVAGVMIFMNTLDSLQGDPTGDAVAVSVSTPVNVEPQYQPPQVEIVEVDWDEDELPPGMVPELPPDALIADNGEFLAAQDLAIQAVAATIAQSTDPSLMAELFAPDDRPEVGLVIDPDLTFELVKQGAVWADEGRSEKNFARLWVYTELLVIEGNDSKPGAATWVVELTHDLGRWWVNRISLREMR